MITEDVCCTDGELHLLRPLRDMASPARDAATRWLLAHGLTPSSVAIGQPITRDDDQNVLIWREVQADGSLMKRWRYAPDDGHRLWPAPFPETLTDPPPLSAPASGREQHPAAAGNG